MDMTGLFFFAGGAAMLAHIALCALLVRGLANDGAAKEALMAIPNRPLAPTSSIRLLRARYYPIARQSSWQVRVIQDGKGSRGIWIMPLMIVAGKL